MQRLDEFRGPHRGPCGWREVRWAGDEVRKIRGGLESVGHDGAGTGSGFGQSSVEGVRRIWFSEGALFLGCCVEVRVSVGQQGRREAKASRETRSSGSQTGLSRGGEKWSGRTCILKVQVTGFVDRLAVSRGTRWSVPRE